MSKPSRSQRAACRGKAKGERVGVGNGRSQAQDPTPLEQKGRIVKDTLLKVVTCDLRLKDELR